jgi:LmbE family N-acetylglucosaminyl deacetylase
MGELRQREASAAMKSLGIEENQMVFLGYPDYGTLNIFKKYWNSLKSYRSILTKVDHNPYPLSLTPGAQYKAVEILDDFKKVIRDFGPTKIFVTHPADNNADHQAAFLFVQVALWDLGMDSQKVSILTYLVHHTNWPSPLGYHPEVRLSPPKYLQVPYIQWFDFDLDSRQLTAKKEAIQFFKTQIPYKPKFLFTFVRQNELFAVNQEFRLAASGSSVLDWSKEEKVQSAMINNRMRKPFHYRLYHSVVYALSENKLNLRIRLNQSYSQDVSMDIYLFGYTRNVLFKDMPKIHLKLDKNMNAEVYDGMKHLRRNGVHVSKSGNDLVISLPLALLNTPEKVFGSVGLRIQSLPLESSSWEVMEMDYGT